MARVQRSPPEKAPLVLAVVLHLPLLPSANVGHTRAFQHGSSRFVVVEDASWRRRLFGNPASVTPERLLPEGERAKRSLQTVMLNDILAVCVAAAVVVVIATILGAVELVRKVVATICDR